MTQEEKNIKICEALGWKFTPPLPPENYTLEQKILASACWTPPGADAWIHASLPNHFTDLNACHEMEKVLDEKQEWKYLAKLVAQVSIGKEHTVSWNRERTYHATAAQRAEAFGLTLKLWKPGE